MKAYRTVGRASLTETVINRSRFIGQCFPVKSEGEALEALAAVRKRYYDASKHCFAYRIGENASTARFSDDGEPGGTAGMPIMDVLVHTGVTDTLCVVTRYFGGVLLGAGGLVRAYSDSAADAVREAGVMSYVPAVRISFTVDYKRYGAVENFLREWPDVRTEPPEFLENVRITACVETEKADAFISALTERTDGRVAASRDGETYLIRPNG